MHAPSPDSMFKWLQCKACSFSQVRGNDCQMLPLQTPQNRVGPLNVRFSWHSNYSRPWTNRDALKADLVILSFIEGLAKIALSSAIYIFFGALIIYTWEKFNSFFFFFLMIITTGCNLSGIGLFLRKVRKALKTGSLCYKVEKCLF